jgi:D-glucosaminate-6-phosphate ammonia-lyase
VPVPFGSVLSTTTADLRAAIGPRTVALLYVAGDHLRRGALPLRVAVEVAHHHGVPVVVDAAAQLPPRSNLWHFTRGAGADLALFSGGKDLRGPQASGLMVGRRDLVDAVAMHASPNQRFGRAFKTGKEEIMGLLAAVEEYMRQDEDERLRGWHAVLERWRAGLASVPGIRVEHSATNEAGQPIPRLIVHLTGKQTAAGAVVDRLLAGEPAVAVATVSEASIGLTPDCLLDGEQDLVVPAVHTALISTGGPR